MRIPACINYNYREVLSSPELVEECVVCRPAEAVRLEDRFVVFDVDHFVDGLLDEDECDEARKVLLCESE